MTWYHARFPPCDLVPCQVLFRHLAPCQLTTKSSPGDMGAHFHTGYCYAPPEGDSTLALLLKKQPEPGNQNKATGAT